MATLLLDLAGTGFEVGERATFGRRADIAVDSANRFMHRVTGEFVRRDGTWFLHNRGSATRLLVFGENGSRLDLPPGTSGALPLPGGSVSFVAGPTPYQLLYRTDGDPPTAPVPLVDGESTIDFGTSLSDREMIYLTTFALDRLRGTGAQLLTYAEVAAVWQVSEKTIDNTLQRVRSRLKAGGVRDTETLEGLVNHLLAHGRIGLHTLIAIENQHPGTLPGG